MIATSGRLWCSRRRTILGRVLSSDPSATALLRLPSLPSDPRYCAGRHSQAVSTASSPHGSSSSSSSSSLLIHDTYWMERVKSKVLDMDIGQKKAAMFLQLRQLSLEHYCNHPLIEYREKQQKQEQQRRLQEEEEEEEQTRRDSKKDGNSDQSENVERIPLSPISDTPKIPKGLFLYGSVGTGKSMLMDAFFDLTHCRRKRRYHFHEFLADVHARIHQQKVGYDAMQKDDSSIHHVHPVHAVALELAREYSLLCLDEFQVVDVADAVILSQLLSTLFYYGTVLVTTSNRPVTDLYQDGLHRHTHFTPFTNLLMHHCVVHRINSETDYRQNDSILGSHDSKTQRSPVAPEMFFVEDATEMNGSRNQLRIEKLLQELLGPSAKTTTKDLDAGFQRTFQVSASVNTENSLTLAAFDFPELCGGSAQGKENRGASDFRAIAQTFDVVYLKNIPVLSDSSKQRSTGHNQARRFITLIDELYEAKTAFICSAAALPSELFVTTLSSSSELQEGQNGETEENLDDLLALDQARTSDGYSQSALASVRELRFAFKRASSRLVEMTSPKWWGRIHTSIKPTDS